jgi:hypothetical protein
MFDCFPGDDEAVTAKAPAGKFGKAFSGVFQGERFPGVGKAGRCGAESRRRGCRRTGIRAGGRGKAFPLISNGYFGAAAKITAAKDKGAALFVNDPGALYTHKASILHAEPPRQ